MLTAEDTIKDTLTWIDENLDRQLNIEEVALRAGYSKWHFQRAFMQVMNISLATYIREMRLTRAARDLVETNDAIIHILVRYGFDSQPTFTRMFSQRFKISPARYRAIKRTYTVVQKQ